MANHPPEHLRDLLEEWTSNGAIRFRWPIDDVGELRLRAEIWKSIWVSFLGLRNHQRYPAEGIRETSDGPDIEAALDFWSKVPMKGIEVLADRKLSEKVGNALESLADAIEVYRARAEAELENLRSDLDRNRSEHRAFSWLPWMSEDERSADLHAIERFDAKMDAVFPPLRHVVQKTVDIFSEVGSHYADVHYRTFPVENIRKAMTDRLRKHVTKEFERDLNEQALGA